MKDFFYFLQNPTILEIFACFTVTSVFIYFIAVMYLTATQARELKKFSGEEEFKPKKKKK